MSQNEEADCRALVLNYCLAINEWERVQTILGRIEQGQFVPARDRELVTGITPQAHLESHAAIFAQYIVPRERKYGSNPRQPKSWTARGRFVEISPETIHSVTFRKPGCAEVVTGWGHIFPGHETMFVLKKIDDHWRIDGLKLKLEEGWETAHL